jgi:hypothetical protein
LPEKSKSGSSRVAREQCIAGDEAKGCVARATD